MAFSGFDSNSGHQVKQPLAEINMIPLIDVMLVLLIVFMIAAPLMSHSVRIDLPKASSQPMLSKPDSIQLSIKAEGDLFWNGEAVSRQTVSERLSVAAGQTPQPELHIHADAKTPYEILAQTMATAARAGLVKIGFVSDPSTPF